MRKSAQRFLTEEPRPTVWWLERAVWILSHTTTRISLADPSAPGSFPRCSTTSCGWTASRDSPVPISTPCCGSDDEVVAAWCRTERVEDDWAGALARAAQCSKGWVYERRKQLLATYKIDIALPFAFYRDLVFFGPNSLTKPKDRAALNAALARGDAATNLRLRQQAAKDFDRRRIDVVGATVRAPALLMSPKVAIDRTVAAHDQLDAEPAIQSVAPRQPDVGAVKVRGPVGAKGNSPGALNLRGGTRPGARGQGRRRSPSNARQASHEPLAGPSAGAPTRAAAPPIGSLPPAPAEKRVGPHALRSTLLPPPQRRAGPHALCSPPPPLTEKKDGLRGGRCPPPPPTVKKITLRTMRSAAASGNASGRPASRVTTLRRSHDQGPRTKAPRCHGLCALRTCGSRGCTMKSTSKKIARPTIRTLKEDADPVGLLPTLSAKLAEAYHAQLRAFLRRFLLVRFEPAVQRRILDAGKYPEAPSASPRR